jgi:hypothetical protein
MRAGHIAAVEEMLGHSDSGAIEKSLRLFEERKASLGYDGFEVWQLSRMVIQFPPVKAKIEAEIIPFSTKRSR